MTGKPRRYTDEEFALILRKAFEFQEQPGTPMPAQGLALSDIQAIAREVGLDPALVERAAAFVATSDQGPASVLFGAPTTYQLTYSAAGEVPKEELARLVDVIRQATGHHGAVEEVLGALEWKTVGQVSQTHVTVRPHEGRTSVHVSADRGGAAILTLVLPGTAWFIAMGITGATLDVHGVGPVLALMGGALVGWLATVRVLWKSGSTRFGARLRALMAAVSDAVDRAATSTADAEAHRGPG